MKNISMLVLSCDAYTNLGYIFFELQNKFMGWFEDDMFFVNESEPFEYKNVITIHVGKNAEWSDKVRIALDRIKTDFVLFMLEDYFIGEIVVKKTFLDAVQTMKDNDLKYYRITPIPNIKGASIIADYLVDIPYNVRYGINLQCAIFRKDFLAEIVQKEGLTAWQIENNLNKNIDEKKNDPIPGCVADTRGIIDIHNGVIKGKWFPKTIKYFNSIGYHIDLGNRELMKRKELARMMIVGTMSHFFSARSTRRIKMILRKLGVKFVTD